MAKPAATPLAFRQDADCTEPVAFATHCRPFRKESRYFRRGVLGAAGLLTGRRAACHWAWRELLPVFGAIPDDGRIVRDGNILSGGGVTAGIDFVLALIAELRGQRIAEMVQLGLEYAPQPPFNAGRPDTAPAEVLEAVNAHTASNRAERRVRFDAWAATHRISQLV